MSRVKASAARPGAAVHRQPSRRVLRATFALALAFAPFAVPGQLQAAAAQAAPGMVGAAAPDLVEINLLGFNDFHGRLFDYETDSVTNIQSNATLSFAGTIEELRAQSGEANTVVFSVGDNIGASLFTSSLQQDEPTIEILNALDLAASSVGNHEFDAGYDFLNTTVSGWADFDYLGANVYWPDGSTALPEYAIVTVDGIDIAIIGAVTETVPAVVRPGGIAGLTFGDPVEAVNRVAAKLEAAGDADVIVAAYHEGAALGEGSTLAEQVASSAVFDSIVNKTTELVDAIYTAHTHREYAWDGPVAGGTRPVIQGGSYGNFVSQVELSVDRATGDVVGYNHRNVPVTTTPMADLVSTYSRVHKVKTILDGALQQSQVVGNNVIGRVNADITTAYSLDQNGTPVRDDRTAESTLGNLVANALRDELSDPHLGAAEIGVVNPGGLRAELLRGTDGGQITFAEANAVLPFLNDLWSLSLTGEQFVTLLEQQWQPFAGSSRFRHLGLSDNVSYTVDPDAADGSHITSVWISGAPIDLSREYRIGTYAFLAEGGDNFTVFRDATAVQQTGLIDRDAWMSYITTNSPLSPDFARRSVIATSLPTEARAGEQVEFEVSRLDLTSLGSPANTEISVRLVPVTHAAQLRAAAPVTSPVLVAPVTDGAAAISFTVPADLAGDFTVKLIARPSGTFIGFPMYIHASVPGDSTGDGDGTSGDQTPGGAGELDQLAVSGARDHAPVMLAAALIIVAGALMMRPTASKSVRRRPNTI